MNRPSDCDYCGHSNNINDVARTRISPIQSPVCTFRVVQKPQPKQSEISSGHSLPDTKAARLRVVRDKRKGGEIRQMGIRELQADRRVVDGGSTRTQVSSWGNETRMHMKKKKKKKETH
jgi:hypothetical protein